jgi:hypothetical protein
MCRETDIALNRYAVEESDAPMARLFSCCTAGTLCMLMIVIYV